MKDFLRSGHLPTLLACLLHFETSFLVWVLVGSLGVLIAADLGLTPAEKGLLVGVPLLGGALWRAPVGLLSDRLGAKRVGLATLVVTMVPLVLAWRVAADLPGLLAVGLLLGVAGSSFAVALPLASRTYPARYQGIAMGVAAAGNSGSVVANLVAPRLGQWLGWQEVFGLALVPAAIAAVVFLTVARADLPAATRAASGMTDPRSPWRQAELWWFCLLYSLTFGGYAGLASFLAIYFHDQHQVEVGAAGALVAVCAVAGSLARPLGGALADRWGGAPVLSAVFALAPGGLVAPIAGAPIAVTLPALMFVLACLGVGNGAVFRLVPQRFGGSVGLVTGLVGAAGGVGGFLLPLLLGLQRELAGSYSLGFATYALGLAAMFLALRALESGWRLSWLEAGHPTLAEAIDPIHSHYRGGP